MKRVINTLFLLFVLAGCAATSPIKPEVSNNLRSNKIAAAFYMVNKSISYNELLFKVLWNETRTQVSKFEGFWDIDKDLCQVLVKEMTKHHLNTIPIHDVLTDPPAYTAFADAIRKPVWNEGERVPLQLDEIVINHLRESGIRYIVAIRSAHFYLDTTPMNSSGPMYIPSDLRVYDIQNAEEVYGINYPIGGRIEWGKTVRNIESNSLAILKESSREWVRLSAEKDLPNVLGLLTE